MNMESVEDPLIGEAIDLIKNLKIDKESDEPKKIGERCAKPEEYQNKPADLIGDSIQISPKLKLHTLAQIVLVLHKSLAQARNMIELVDVTHDLDYWRALAISRAREIVRFGNVIELQKKRIDCLERDLGLLVNLAQETQKMLSNISPEQLEI